VSPQRPTLTVIGRRLADTDHRLRDFLTRIAQDYDWLEAGTPGADEALRAHGLTEADLPVVVDGPEITPQATIERLAELWRMSTAPARAEYDVVIVGAGPAGLAAAVYAASDGLDTLLLEREVPGGQASHTSLIENFFGFPEGIEGATIARLAGRQAEKFGAELLLLRGIEGGGPTGDGSFTAKVRGGSEVTARAMIVAPGMDWRRLELDGIDALLGRGVYYGAGRSEARPCAGRPVVVVGAGNSAGQAVMHLSEFGAQVTMVVRGGDLGKSMSAYLVERIADNPLVDVRLHTEVAGVHADDHGDLAAVTLRSGDARKEQPASALFLCLGGIPRTGWAADTGVRTDRNGFILTGPDLLEQGQRPADWPLPRDPLALETSVPGMFAAGDVRSGSMKRVAGAVGDGATAVGLVHRWLAERAA
jgi:thioredoxin reductase (NADPH)